MEGLPLSQPYPPPYFQEPSLPACSQYTCSCCNRTHALAIHRSLRPAHRDPGFSRACLAWLLRLSCRVCHPEVGVGLMPSVCPAACDAWLAACRDEFFSFEPHAPSAFEPLRLAPCAHAAAAAAAAGSPGGSEGGGGGEGSGGGEGGGVGGPLICSRLGDVARDGAELCREAGLMVAADRGSDGAACFDGGFSPFATDFCVKPPPPSARGGGGGARRRATAAGHGGGGAAVAEGVSPPVYFLAGAVLLSLAWLGYTTFTGIQAKEAERAQQLHWRQLRGRTD